MQRVLDFHEHDCPDIRLGVRAARLARERLGDGPIVAVVETDGCVTDAVQYVIGATLGTGRLLVENNGRPIFSFWSDGAVSGLRVLTRTDRPGYPDTTETALATQIANGTASADAAEQLRDLQQKRSDAIADADVDTLFDVTEIDGPSPAARAVEPYEDCATCGEPARRNRLFVHDGRTMCPPCHLASHHGKLPAQHPKDPLPRTYH